MPKYTDKEIERILRTLVLCEDKPSKAAQQLEVEGFPVPVRTIQELRNTHAERYEWLSNNQRRWVSTELAGQARRTAKGIAGEAERLLRSISRMSDEQLDKGMTLNTKSQALAALSRAAGILMDKTKDLEDHAASSEENESLSLQEVRDRLEGMGIEITVGVPRHKRAKKAPAALDTKDPAG